MALAEVDLKAYRSCGDKAARKSEITETNKPDELKASMTEQRTLNVPAGVNPVIAAIVERDIRDHADVWKALANQ